jgi:transcriptional regulator with XRE-family HTH domain
MIYSYISKGGSAVVADVKTTSKTGKKKVSTSMLLSRILSTKNIKNFLSRNKGHLKVTPLAEYLAELCALKGLRPRDVVKNADIDRVYGAEIFSGKRTNPSRDYIIRLAFGLELDYDECQQLLRTARKSELYPRVPRDALIISSLHNRQSFQQTETMLYENKMTTLGGCE